MLTKYFTAKVNLTSHNPEEKTTVIRLDAEPHVIIQERNNRAYGRRFDNFVVGPAADRLSEYESLGRSPEELRTIIQKNSWMEMNLKPFRTDPLGKVVAKSETRDGLRFTCALIDEMHEYVNNDIDVTRKLGSTKPAVKNVIFNDPATIIFWTDGTKTVVKCQEGDTYNRETGFVMAYLKKVLGNDNTFNKEIERWVPEESISKAFAKLGEKVAEGFKDAVANEKEHAPVKTGRYPWDEMVRRAKEEQ